MLGTGVPGVFGPYWQAMSEHLRRYAADQVTKSWQTIPAPPTIDDLLNLWYPARILVPKLPAKFFEETAATFNDSHIGVACNSFDPGAGIEYLDVNDVGMTLITEHHDPDAAYGHGNDRVIYQPITPAALRNASWAARYSVSVTWSPQVTVGTSSSGTVSDKARWVMKVDSAAPCQCHFPGGV
jgi:hypothetical protein